MKFLLGIFSLLVVGNAGISDSANANWETRVIDHNVEMFWITSANGPRVDNSRISERHIISYFRNKYITWDMYWADSLHNMKWTWILYGEVQNWPCVEEHGPWDDFTPLGDLQFEVQKAGEPTYMSDGTYNHCGWDVIAHYMRRRDQSKRRNVVVWDNMIFEDANKRPYPEFVDLNYICDEPYGPPGQYTYGHVTWRQIEAQFGSNKPRVYIINYADARVVSKYEFAFKSDLRGEIRNIVDSMPVNNDPNESKPDFWYYRGQDIIARLQEFMISHFNTDVLDLDLDHPDHMRDFQQIYWPRYLEVYGKHATKPWKKYFHLEDDHPDNLAAFIEYKKVKGGH